MIDEGKELILKVQDIIDIILENQNNYAIDRDIMVKLNEYFESNSEIFDNDFIAHYLNFIGLFNPFFDFLLDKLVSYENSLLKRKEIIDDCFFAFNFNEFDEKDILKPYNEIPNCLEAMFPKNVVMQGVVFYLHLNILLKKHMFNNNRIRIVNQIPVVDIDYGNRISFYKEEYITIFRHELEEGIRNSVFLDDDEIIEYIRQEIKTLENALDI